MNSTLTIHRSPTHLAAVVAVSLLCGLGCASTLTPCPAEGGRAWRELSTEHFVLSTDLDVKEARATITQLETYREGLLRSAWPGAEDQETGQIPVYVFSDPSDFNFFYKDVSGFFGSRLFQPLIVFSSESWVDASTVIKHELVHFLARFYLPRQTRWIAEGLATFFETLDVDEAEHEVTVGRPAPSRLQFLQQTHVVLPAKELFQEGAKPGDESFFYASAWLMTHYLMNTHPEDFAAYQKSLQSVDALPDAWNENFPQLDPATLDNELRRYLAGGSYQIVTRNFQPPLIQVQELPLSHADVHALRALFFLAANEKMTRPTEAEARNGARSEVNEALRLEPNHVLASAVRDLLIGEPAGKAMAETLAKAHQNDWLAWVLLAGALKAPEDAERRIEAMNHALDLAEENPAVAFPFRLVTTAGK